MASDQVTLIRYRVTNFRSVVDSGWIDAERVTALIGVNESGKTNLLLPLWKLNPAREGEIVPTSDYPKANYAAVRANPGAFIFVTAEFAIPGLADKLSELTGADAGLLDRVQVSRAFDAEYTLAFPKYTRRTDIDGREAKSLIDGAVNEIKATSALQKEAHTKAAMLDILNAVNAMVDAAVPLTAPSLEELIKKLRPALPETPAATSTIAPRFLRVIKTLEGWSAQLNAPPPSDIEDVSELILENLPRFVYYSNYGNLDSEIYLPHVVQNLKRIDLGAREAAKARTLRVLFSFVKLEPDQILELGRDFRDPTGRQPTASEIEIIATKKRERTILLHSAGTDLTKKFRDWWKQGDYTFDFQADGDHFRIWVSDSKRPEKVELEDRSTGLQWFLSFYLIFLVESSGDHRNSILLLDEPGLSLHPLAQRDLSAFFEGLGDTNQILYTTHSPFLVDADMLDRARKVFVAEDGSTKASADLRRGSDDPRKAGATYAIYSALNMNVAESILYGCHPVIVEGPSDQHYLATIKALLIGAQKISPKRELVFPPSHGVKNAKVVASILSGRDEVLPYVLTDGDAVGRKIGNDLRNGLYQSAKERVLVTDTYVGFAESEVEDLFPAAFMADVIDRWERRPEKPFADIVESGKPIVPQIEAWAKVNGLALTEGWKVDLSRHVKTRALARGITAIGEPTTAKWVQLFEAFAPGV